MWSSGPLCGLLPPPCRPTPLSLELASPPGASSVQAGVGAQASILGCQRAHRGVRRPRRGPGAPRPLPETGALVQTLSSVARNSSPRGPGLLFCFVFSACHQSDDSTRVASGMEMFKSRVRTKLQYVIAGRDWRFLSLVPVPWFSLASVP